MHAYVEAMSFADMRFDEGCRHFLSGFRLPGEAAQIDRLMEKFAERYCIDNPGTFANADTAFVLAFSVVMLQTDLHNPNIKPERKMTKKGFLRNNQGIDAGQDLPAEFLSDIFDRIEKEPFSLDEDDKLRERLEGAKGDTGGGLFGGGSQDRKKRE